MNDWELLQAWANNRSESAFAELVRRYLDLVHAAALRQVTDPELARDLAQAVFLALSRQVILGGWPLRTTRFVAARAQRTEQRRRHRETDDFSYSPVENPVHLNDLKATIPYCLGIDHERFTFKSQGLNQRLTGVEPAAPVKAILA